MSTKVNKARGAPEKTCRDGFYKVSTTGCAGYKVSQVAQVKGNGKSRGKSKHKSKVNYPTQAKRKAWMGHLIRERLWNCMGMGFVQ
jgi:hypothetical protein